MKADESAGNFARELRLDELGTRPTAKLIIELLARVYDPGPSDKLEYYAPLLSAKKGNPAIVDQERCPVPTSSLRRDRETINDLLTPSRAPASPVSADSNTPVA